MTVQTADGRVDLLRRAALATEDSEAMWRALQSAERENRYQLRESAKLEAECHDLREQVKRLHAWREESFEIIAARNETIERVRKQVSRWRSRSEMSRCEAPISNVLDSCVYEIEQSLRDPEQQPSGTVTTTGPDQQYGGELGRKMALAEQHEKMQAELLAQLKAR